MRKFTFSIIRRSTLFLLRRVVSALLLCLVNPMDGLKKIPYFSIVYFQKRFSKI
ncbi:hypothetical protein IC582_028394 [Cucumis melo]